jgi:NitT/TauT family transport system ATP-binding protein
MAAVIRLDRVSVQFPGAEGPVLADVALQVERGEFAAIVGASGAGKSTLLRIIAGLEPLGGGAIERHFTAAAGRRPVAIVFQEARLMPWRPVETNVGLGLEGLGLSAAERTTRIQDALALVGLDDLAARWPYQLSGGQRQRVGIARALAVAPDLLLMDEPFASLDAITRHALQDELLRIWRATGTTIVFVTHDIEEAVYLADRVLLLGGAPARVTENFAVAAPRPRRRQDDTLASVASRVRASLSDSLLEGGGI